MIVLKIASFLLVWLLVLEPSSAFLPDKCNIQLDPTRLFEGDVDAKDFLKAASCVGSLLKTNYGLIKKFPTTFQFIENLIQKGTSAITSNPAYVGTSVYFTAVVLLSHYSAIEAKKQLLQAKFEQDDLNMLIESEIVPLLRFIEMVLIKEGAKNGLNKFCLADTYMKDTFDRAVENLQKVRNNIEKKMMDSTTGEENNSFFQKLSGVTGMGGLFLVAAAPCPFTAFLACPAMIAGAGAIASSGVGVMLFGNNKLTHQQTFELLEQARENAMMAEQALRKARVNIGLVCVQYKIHKPPGIINTILRLIHILFGKYMPEVLSLE